MVSMGEKFAPGYQVNIDRVEEKEGKWVVEASFTKPAEEDYSGTATYPFEVIGIKDDGKPVEVLETEDQEFKKLETVEIPEAMSLAASKNFIVFYPREGELITNPITVKGKARVFEATFRITLEDGHNELATKPVMTDEGAPGWGYFEVTTSYDKPSNPQGHIIFSYENMENGNLIKELLLPVKF